MAMADDIPFDRTFEPATGQAVPLSPLVRRLTAPNPGPFTFTGTNTYLVGRGAVAVIDPGPDDNRHWEALMAALAGETVSAILLTHTHRDHSPLAARLAAHTGAPLLAEGPHRPSRDLALGEVNPMDASADMDFVPTRTLADGALIAGDGWTLETVLTPGHTANHASFALHEENTLFSGDHVMAWATSVIAPPDGAMGDYMRSLRKVAARGETLHWPGHGGPVRNAKAFTNAYVKHRLMREAAIVDKIAGGTHTIPALVAAIYGGLDPRLTGAAALSVLAHLEDLVARGVVRADPGPALDAVYVKA